jgi:uncharacterized protein (TIGR03435 family)
MMELLGQAAISLSAFPLSLLVKATVILAAALMAVRYAGRTTASMRHLLLASAFAVLLILPIVERVAPPITVPVDRGASAVPLLPITRLEIAPAGNAVPSGPTTPEANAARGGDATGWSWSSLMFAVWVLGAFVCLVPVLLTPWRLHGLRRSSRPWAHGSALVRSLQSDPVTRDVSVLIQDEATAPLTCGVARPAILLPGDVEQWNEADIRQALVHELEHVRRSDWPVYVGTRIVCALYWFHPLVWMAWRRLGLEAERACDDAVLRVAERTAYAQQLVTLARHHVRPSAIPVLSMAGRSDLSARVAAVLDESQVRGRLGLVRSAVIAAGAIVLGAAVGPLRAQGTQIVVGRTADAPAFDVVSIKENKSGENGQTIRRQPGGRIITSNYPVRALIMDAFGLQPQQLIGEPDWMPSARYDITAQTSADLVPTEPGTVGQAQLMMQRLLADRFRLAVHTERRELPIYVLTVARSDRRLGPRLRTAALDCQALMSEALKRAQTGAPPTAPQRPDGGPGCGMRFGPGGLLTAGGTSMAALARMLAGPVGRIVEDRTMLTGGFDLDLEFALDPAALAGVAAGAPLPPADPGAPSIFTALEEQLGLKLQAERAPVEVLVIDRVERPTEN